MLQNYRNFILRERIRVRHQILTFFGELRKCRHRNLKAADAVVFASAELSRIREIFLNGDEKAGKLVRRRQR